MCKSFLHQPSHHVRAGGGLLRKVRSSPVATVYTKIKRREAYVRFGCSTDVPTRIAQTRTLFYRYDGGYRTVLASCSIVRHDLSTFQDRVLVYCECCIVE